jgi:plasmid stabilization system protein ParE
LDSAFRWLAEQSPDAAERWRNQLRTAILSLTSNPRRFGLAPEADWYQGELRQMLVGKRRGIYRILYEIRESTIYVVRIRHGRQDLLTPESW